MPPLQPCSPHPSSLQQPFAAHLWHPCSCCTAYLGPFLTLLSCPALLQPHTPRSLGAAPASSSLPSRPHWHLGWLFRAQGGWLPPVWPWARFWQALSGPEALGCSSAQPCHLACLGAPPVTIAAVCMGVEELGMQTRHRGTYNQPPSQDQDQ